MVTESAKPVALDGMSRAELDAELSRGVESLKARKLYSVEEVDDVLAREFGL